MERFATDSKKVARRHHFTEISLHAFRQGAYSQHEFRLFHVAYLERRLQRLLVYVEPKGLGAALCHVFAKGKKN